MTFPVQTHLSDDQAYELNQILGQIKKRKFRNDLLTAYYNGKVKVQSLGIAIPKEWNVLNTVVGWAAMPSDVLNERTRMDKFFVSGDAGMTDRLNELWLNSNMPAESQMLQVNTFNHGVGFMVGTKDPDAGPLIVPEPATRMSGSYNRRIRQMTAAASNDDRVEKSFARVKPLPQASYYTREGNYVVERDGSRWKILSFDLNGTGVLPVERLINRPDFERPWGASEMTPAVLSYTDAAVRTLMGMEVSREFYAAPQRYLLGVGADSFVDKDGNAVPAWLSYIGKVLAVERDGEGQIPQAGTFAAASPAPFIDGVKMLSQLFSAETGIPATNMGFTTENPASEGAIVAADYRTISRAEQRQQGFGPRYAQAGKFLLLADGVPADKIPHIEAQFLSAATPTLAAQGDFTQKMVAAGVLDPEAVSTLRKLGFTRADIDEILDERRRKAGSKLIENLAAAASAARTDPTVVELASRRTADAVTV